jgi:hypothetical protein
MRRWRKRPGIRLPRKEYARRISRASRQRWAVAVLHHSATNSPNRRASSARLPGLTGTCRSRRRAAVISKSFPRRARQAEIQTCSRSKPSCRDGPRRQLRPFSESRRACRGQVWREGGRSFRSGWLSRRHLETALMRRMLLRLSRCTGHARAPPASSLAARRGVRRGPALHRASLKGHDSVDIDARRELRPPGQFGRALSSRSCVLTFSRGQPMSTEDNPREVT